MSGEQKPKEPISLAKIGGVKVGHPIPVKGSKEIDFSAIGGKLVLKSPLWADARD